MTYFKLIIGILSLSMFLNTQNAYGYTPKRGNVTATLGPYVFKTNYANPEAGLTSPDQGGLALTALGDVNDSGSLEIAVIYMNKIYFRQDQGMSVSEKTQLIHVTMGYRYWIGSYFSTSLGLYTSYPMGDVEILHDNFPPGKQITTTARKTTETGLDWALQAELWSKNRFALVVEGRYSLSLTKEPGEHSDQYGFSLGVRYFVQGPDEPKP